MNPVSACGICHKAFGVDENRHPFGDQIICSACLQAKSDMGQVCPACRQALSPDDQEIGLVLSKFDSQRHAPIAEPVVMLIVCPKCRVIFCDLFQYKILQGLKPDVARLAVR